MDLQPDRHERDGNAHPPVRLRALADALAGSPRAPRRGDPALQGLTLFLQGLFTLDCQGIDSGCENTSWQSEGHRWVSRLSGGALAIAPIVLAIAFRRLPRWRDAWLPTLVALPLVILASILFSAIGDGAATRAGAIVWLAWLAFLAVRLFQQAEQERVRTALA
jgi:Protein of unknown function (DUF998)